MHSLPHNYCCEIILWNYFHLASIRIFITKAGISIKILFVHRNLNGLTNNLNISDPLLIMHGITTIWIR